MQSGVLNKVVQSPSVFSSPRLVVWTSPSIAERRCGATRALGSSVVATTTLFLLVPALSGVPLCGPSLIMPSGVNAIDSFDCPVCAQSFSTKGDLAKHLRTDGCCAISTVAQQAHLEALNIGSCDHCGQWHASVNQHIKNCSAKI